MVVEKAIAFFKRSMSCETLGFKQVMDAIVPAVFDTLLLAVINMANTAMVSSSGPGVVAATSLTATLSTVFQCIFSAFTTGGSILIAQNKGRRDMKKLCEVMREMFLTGVVLAAVVGALLILFGRPVFVFFYGAINDELVIQNGVLYLMGISLSHPIFSFYQSALATLRAMGDGKACMAVSVTSGVVNILVNCITIYGFRLGIVGIVISTTCNRVAAAFLAYWLLKKRHPELEISLKTMFRHSRGTLKRLFLVSVPFFLEGFFYSAGNLVNSSVLTSCGAAAVDAMSIANSMMFWQAASGGVETGSLAVIAQCVGAGRPKEARRMTNNFIWLGTGIVAVTAAVLLPLTNVIMAAYSPTPEAAQYIPSLVLIGAATWLLVAPSGSIGASGMRASGDALFASIVAMVAMWGIRIGLGYVLAIVCGMGVYGIFLAIALEWAFRGALFTWRRCSKYWCRHSLI